MTDQPNYRDTDGKSRLEGFRVASGTNPPATAPDAPDGPEIPSRSAISDEDRASIRKISERLGVPLTAFEELIADGEAQRDRAGGLAALLKAERETTASLQVLVKSFQGAARENREALDGERARSDAISGALKREQMRYAELHELNRALRESASGLEARYDESRELLAQAGIRMVALEAERNAAVAAIDTLRDMIRQRDAENDPIIEKLESDLLDRNNDIEHLISRIVARDAMIEDLRAQIARLDHDIASREQATLRRDERIAELFGLVEGREREIEALTKALGEALDRDATINTLRAKVETADDHAEQFHERIAGLAAKVEARDQTLDQFRERVAELSNVVATRDATIEHLNRCLAIGQEALHARDRLLDRILDVIIDAKGGEAKPTSATCERCDGEGVVRVEVRPHPNDVSPVTREQFCPDCSAEGGK